MKKSIKKLQKHKKKHKKTIKNKHSHHKSSRYSKRYKGGNGDEFPMPNPKRARYNPPNPPTPDEEEKRHIQTFMNRVIDIKNNGPMVSAISAPETVYALMVKILNLWNYVIQNIRIPRNIDTARNIIDNLYNDVVIAYPQIFAMMDDDDEEHYIIINYKSNEILDELFHIVSNISDNTLNETVEIPSIDIFTAPDRDNPDIVQFIQENNHMDEE
jgi:hypothetical protein